MSTEKTTGNSFIRLHCFGNEARYKGQAGDCFHNVSEMCTPDPCDPLVQGTSSILVGRMSVCTAGRLAQTSQPTFHATAKVFNHNTERKAKYVASYTGPRLRQKTHRYTAAHNSDH